MRFLMFAAALMLALPASAAEAPVGVVYDPSGERVLMIVAPDNAAQLDDPAFNPPGTQQYRVAREAVRGLSSPEEVVELLPAQVRARVKAKRQAERGAVEASLRAQDEAREAARLRGGPQ